MVCPNRNSSADYKKHILYDAIRFVIDIRRKLKKFSKSDKILDNWLSYRKRLKIISKFRMSFNWKFPISNNRKNRFFIIEYQIHLQNIKVKKEKVYYTDT